MEELINEAHKEFEKHLNIKISTRLDSLYMDYVVSLDSLSPEGNYISLSFALETTSITSSQEGLQKAKSAINKAVHKLLSESVDSYRAHMELKRSFWKRLKFLFTFDKVV